MIQLPLDERRKRVGLCATRAVNLKGRPPIADCGKRLTCAVVAGKVGGTSN